MHTLTNAPKLVKLFGAALALTLLATAALAVALTTGPAQAQDPRNIYDDPQPCGPGAAPAYQPEPHEVSEGHFALFDGYWQWRSQDPINVGVLHTNLCPPLVTQTTETDPFGQPIGVITTLTDSGIDVEVAIIHVLDEHQATVVDGNPDDLGDRELPGGQFVEFFNDEHTNPGDEVWWLRLDDPNTDVVETSDLTLGFSTKRFDDRIGPRMTAPLPSASCSSWSATRASTRTSIPTSSPTGRARRVRPRRSWYGAARQPT